MLAPDEVGYRLRLAAGFLAEARQDVALQRWRSSVDNSQLATENAAKAVLALPGPVGRTHNPAALLREELARDVFAGVSEEQVRQLPATQSSLALKSMFRATTGMKQADALPGSCLLRMTRGKHSP